MYLRKFKLKEKKFHQSKAKRSQHSWYFELKKAVATGNTPARLEVDPYFEFEQGVRLNLDINVDLFVDSCLLFCFV